MRALYTTSFLATSLGALIACGSSSDPAESDVIDGTVTTPSGTNPVAPTETGGIIPVDPNEEVLLPADDGNAASPVATVDVGMECESVSERGMPVFRPQDIILVVDNSGSMDGEAQAVQDRINQDLAAILDASGIDYRVILLSRYGEVGSEVGAVETGICIGAPLGGHDCSNPDTRTGDGGGTQPVANTERFFHYSEDIDSTNAWCQILDRFTSAEHADDHPGITDDGWQQYARPDAFKNFVVITDDHVECDSDDGDFNDLETPAGAMAAAEQFDRVLTTLSPQQFGTQADRNYNFYSITGLQENVPSTAPWDPTAPLSTSECSANGNNVENAGIGYQALSVLTGGLRYPICENGNFDAMFRAIAEGIIEGAALSCEWAIPATGGIDINKVNLSFSGDDGTQTVFPNVPSLADCGAEQAWYYDDPVNPTRLLSCPAMCDQLKLAQGQVDLLFGCQTILGPAR